MDSPKIYIIILNYIGWDDTIECLESVLRNYYPNYQVIVVDNDSPNNSMKYIKAWADGSIEAFSNKDNPLMYLSRPLVKKPIPYIFYTYQDVENSSKSEFERKLKKTVKTNDRINSINHINFTTKYPLVFIQTGNNLGFAGGNNVVLKMILNNDEDCFVWLLNPDMVISKDALKNLFLCFSLTEIRDAIIGFVIKDYYNPDKTLFYGGARINNYTGTIFYIKNVKDINKLDYISGGALFTHINNFSKVGLLYEEYFLYWEDADWCTKAKSIDLELKVSIDSICYDKRGTSIDRTGPQAEYYYTLNSLRYHKKYFPKKLKYEYLLSIFRILKRVIIGKFKNIIAILTAYKDFR